ncbi:MAG: STAS/SEC14 domain-containing protein [Lysobacteraceae bacterium]
MLEKLKNLPAGIEGLKAVGKVTREDYENVFEPLLDAARRDGRRLRLLYQLGAEFDRFTPSAAWEDARLGLHSMRLFDGCAIVTDVAWIRESTRLVAFILPCPVQVFSDEQLEKAVEWLAALPAVVATSHRLLPESGVIVVEVGAPLRSQDFDAIALTADTWIEAHGDLHGIVIHARDFPGWENLGGFFRHMRFIRNHQQKVTRVAVATDSKVASLAPRIAEHFVKAELKAFTYDALESAIAWARDAPE